MLHANHNITAVDNQRMISSIGEGSFRGLVTKILSHLAHHYYQVLPWLDISAERYFSLDFSLCLLFIILVLQQADVTYRDIQRFTNQHTGCSDS